MTDPASHALIRLAVYPAFYWIGFGVTKGLSLGEAIIMPYSELGEEKDAAWWEFRIRRWGFKEWRPESMIIIGGCFVLLVVSGSLRRTLFAMMQPNLALGPAIASMALGEA